MARTANCAANSLKPATRRRTGWVFKLRDAVFHNGAPVTSDDVKWSIEQVTGEKSTAYLRSQLQGVQGGCEPPTAAPSGSS